MNTKDMGNPFIKDGTSFSGRFTEEEQLMRGYFIVMHPACHAKNIENYRIHKGVNAEIKEIAN